MAGLVAGTWAHGDIPPLMTVQGKLTTFGPGPVQIEVRFYDASIPGGPVLGGFCDLHNSVALTDGVFAIVVGSGVDCTSGAMHTFIPTTALTATELQMELTVNGLTQPRERVWSVPFAMGSIAAQALVVPGTFNAAATVDASSNVTVVGNVSTSNKVIASAFAGHSPLIFEAPAGTERARITDAGRLGIGTTAPEAPLHVYASTGIPFSFPTVARFQLERTAIPNTNYAIDLGGSRLDATDVSTGGGTTLYLNYTSDGDVNLAQGGGNVLMGMGGGKVGIGTSSPAAWLSVEADSGTIDLPIAQRVMSYYRDILGNTKSRFLDFAGAQIRAVDSDASIYTALSLNPLGGSVAIGSTSAPPYGDAKLYVRSSDAGTYASGDLDFEDVVIEDSMAWLGLYSSSDGNVASGITFGELTGAGSPNLKWAIYARTQSNVGDLVVTYGTDSNPTANPVLFQILPDGTTKVKVLEITGADVAERFPVSDKVEPGMVVEIDREHAGQLRLARGAYNRRVAGVVSGAGDLPVGAILGNLPGCENAPPIALSGRVWVRCDASEAPIEPGDLLTTAERAGHAIKVTDYPRAQGAIIGKAMSSLENGTGLVLVLVNLQ